MTNPTNSLWTCGICGYEYDPARGDASQDIAAHTAWEDLPDDWVCPDCHMPKSEFANLEEHRQSA